MRSGPTGLAAVVSLVACFAMACSSSDDASAGDGAAGACVPYEAAGVAPRSGTVSFRGEVLPVLQRSCGLSSSCHASSRPPLMGAGVGAAALRKNVVDQPSAALPSMSYVAPGDLARSFLMHKIDGDQCQFDADCAGGSCGRAMPLTSAALPAEERDTIRQWIAQGAADN